MVQKQDVQNHAEVGAQVVEQNFDAWLKGAVAELNLQGGMVGTVFSQHMNLSLYYMMNFLLFALKMLLYICMADFSVGEKYKDSSVQLVYILFIRPLL